MWRQPDFFAAPFENLPLRDAIDFYKHERGWVNRLIAGDSLLVMNSLLQKESLAGRVKIIYIDPPYGIKYRAMWSDSIWKHWIALRATLLVIPVFVLALTNPSFYLAVILKTVALSQQAGEVDARSAGGELVGSTLMGAVVGSACRCCPLYGC